MAAPICPQLRDELSFPSHILVLVLLYTGISCAGHVPADRVRETAEDVGEAASTHPHLTQTQEHGQQQNP